MCAHPLCAPGNTAGQEAGAFGLKNAACFCRVTDKPAEAVTGAPLAEAAEEAMVAAGGDPADGPTPEEEAEAEAKVTLDTCHESNMFCVCLRAGTSTTLPMQSLGNHTQHIYVVTAYQMLVTTALVSKLHSVHSELSMLILVGVNQHKNSLVESLLLCLSILSNFH